MVIPTLLWVDLRNNKRGPGTCTDLSRFCRVHLLEQTFELSDEIDSTCPDVICFEYDYPGARHLQALQRTKSAYPSIPILMITECHSEELVLWALRARVWDYLVTPVSTEDLHLRINVISSFRSESCGDNRKVIFMPHSNLDPDQEVSRHVTRDKAVSLRAMSYVERRYNNKISVSELSAHCAISPTQFSRVFKREYGITFREFLIRYRIERACELLKGDSTPVGDVAFAVGFSDHSHFTRLFRRQTGQAPSCYRLKHAEPPS